MNFIDSELHSINISFALQKIHDQPSLKDKRDNNNNISCNHRCYWGSYKFLMDPDRCVEAVRN